MEKELQTLEEGPKEKIRLDSHKVTRQKYQTWKLPVLTANTDCGLEYQFHPLQTGYRN